MDDVVLQIRLLKSGGVNVLHEGEDVTNLLSGISFYKGKDRVDVDLTYVVKKSGNLEFTTKLGITTWVEDYDKEEVNW